MPDPIHPSPVMPVADPDKGVDVYHEIGTGFSRYSFFFPLNGTQLLPVHYGALYELAAELKTGKYYEMYALADRSGSQAVNYQVAKGRYIAIENGLFDAGFEDDPEDFGETEKIFGEDFWAYRSAQTHSARFQDGVANAQYRVVVVYVWPDAASSLFVHADLPLVEYARKTSQPPV